MSERTARAGAGAILRANDRGGYCVPTARLYPFQWNWDSAFVAHGLGHASTRPGPGRRSACC